MARSYVETALLKGEELIYAGNLHWIIFLPGLFSTVFGTLLCGITPALLNSNLGLGLAGEFRNYILYAGLSLIGGGILLLGHSYMRLISTELAITNRRVIAKAGFISRNTFEIMLNRVEGANIEQTVWGRILGFGSILVHGTGGGITPIDYIADPLNFKKQLMTYVEQNQPGARISGG